MRRSLLWFAMLTFACLIGGAWGHAGAQDDQPEIIGSKKCKMCHKSKSKGEQYVIWEASAHARAFETLASEQALAIAKEKGIDNPQEAAECLSCHTTSGAMADAPAGAKYDVAEGVGCEACHGPGSLYKKKSVMKDREASVAAGLLLPDEATCTGCHNEKSPTYKEFNYEERQAKIAHPVPEEE